MADSEDVFNLSTNLNKFKKILDKLAKATGGENSSYLKQVVWESGEIVRDSVQISMQALIYMMPEKKYRRTQFLMHSVYLTTKGKTDRVEAFTKAYSFASTYKPKSYGVYYDYYFSPHVPYNWSNAIRVTAGAHYAAMVEYGGGNNKSGPRPFMRNGALNAQKDVLEFVKAQYNFALEDIAKGRDPRYVHTGWHGL